MYQTCLAFSVAAIKGEKDLGACPYLDDESRERLQNMIAPKTTLEEEQMQLLEELKASFSRMDIVSVQHRLGVPLKDGDLVINCLGKDFFIDEAGNVISSCHTTPWLNIPLLQYALYGSGRDITGRWVHFREFENGTARAPLFLQRCERPLQHLADQYTDLFKDIVEMFAGEQQEGYLDADISLKLMVLPKFPILLCYWQSEGDLESRLNVFFDQVAEKNLPVDYIHMLIVGLVRMFEKISYLHRS